jgi:hypothetical protein
VSTADIQRLAAGAHPNLERTLFVATAAPEIPLAVEAFLCAALDELALLADGVEELESRIATIEAAIAPEGLEIVPGHTALVCRADGYSLLELESPPPEVDEVITVDGEDFTVLRLAPSPFPGDQRRCAILNSAATRA